MLNIKKLHELIGKEKNPIKLKKYKILLKNLITSEAQNNKQILIYLKNISEKKQYENRPKSIFASKMTSEEILAEAKSNLSGEILNQTGNKFEPFHNQAKDLELSEIMVRNSFFTNYLLKSMRSATDLIRENDHINKETLTELQQVLDKLNGKDSSFKYLFQKQHFSTTTVKNFPDSFSKFCKSLNKLKYPNEQDLYTQRAYKNYLPYKFKKTLEGICGDLSKRYGFFKIFENLNDNDFENMLSEISPETIFENIVSLLFTLAKNNLFTQQKEGDFNPTLSDTVFVVKYIILHSEYNVILNIYLTNIMLHYLKNNVDDARIGALLKGHTVRVRIKKDVFEEKLQITDLIGLVSKFLIFEKSKHEHKKWFGISMDLTRQITNMFIDTDIVTRTNDWQKDKLISKLLIHPELEQYIFSTTDFPRLTVPKKTTHNTLVMNTKPIFRGEFNFPSSERIENTMTSLERKPFTVNTNFLRLMEDFCNNSVSSVMYKPFSDLNFDLPSYSEMKNMETKIKDLKKMQRRKKFQLIDYQTIRDKVKGDKRLHLNFYKPFKQLVGITKPDMHLDDLITKCTGELNNSILRLRYLSTCIEMCKILFNFPFYYENSYCVRLRFYPLQALLSRTSGVFKHLICDYKTIRLTNPGLLNFMRCYYHPDVKLSEQFETFLIGVNLKNKKTFLKVLQQFFNENPMNFYKLNPAPYYMLIHVHLLQIFERSNRDCNMPIEIDQKASGVTFLALITRNKMLADHCNIINQKNSDVYEYARSQFPKFYEKHVKNKNKNVLEFFTGSRKTFKYAIMCYCYRQKTVGRFENVFKTRFIQEFKRYPIENETRCLFNISAKFEEFLEILFPNFTKQINLIEKIVGFVVSKKGTIQILNLEGQLLSWDFFETGKSTTRHAFNPHTRNTQDYHFSKPKMVKIQNVDGDEIEIRQRSVKDHTRCFLSYFIHSLDASVIRIITTRLKEKTGYVANTLHDCVLVHPNYVEDLYEVIQEFYSDKELFNMVENLIFTPLRSQIAQEYHAEFDKMVKEFDQNSVDYQSELGNFNPKYLYEFE